MIRTQWTNPSETARPQRETSVDRVPNGKKGFNTTTTRPRPGRVLRGVEYGPKDPTLAAIDAAVARRDKRIRAMPKVIIRRCTR